MDINPEGQNNKFPKQKFEANIMLSNGNIIAVYTILCILLKMRRTLGLEAMLDYVQAYQSIIESSNPDLKSAVKRAVQMVNVKKIYNDAVKEP